MPNYIVLGNFTAQGIKNIADVPKRDEVARRLIEEAGGNLNLYYTMGEYDFVAVVDMPDDDSMVAFLVKIGSLGNVTTKTLKAWNEKDFSRVLSRL